MPRKKTIATTGTITLEQQYFALEQGLNTLPIPMRMPFLVAYVRGLGARGTATPVLTAPVTNIVNTAVTPRKNGRRTVEARN